MARQAFGQYPSCVCDVDPKLVWDVWDIWACFILFPAGLGLKDEFGPQNLHFSARRKDRHACRRWQCFQTFCILCKRQKVKLPTRTLYHPTNCGAALRSLSHFLKLLNSFADADKYVCIQACSFCVFSAWLFSQSFPVHEALYLTGLNTYQTFVVFDSEQAERENTYIKDRVWFLWEVEFLAAQLYKSQESAISRAVRVCWK